MEQQTLESIYPLSPAQKGILFHSLFGSGHGVYLNQVALTLSGPLEPERFERAWSVLAQRHPALRTSFHWEQLERPLQVVRRTLSFPVAFEDQSHLTASEQQAKEDGWLREERLRGLPLDEAPLCRVRLIRLAPERHRMVMTYHHILLDAWSVQLLWSELADAYRGLGEGRELNIEPAPAFRDFIAWLERQPRGRSEEFWRELLRGIGRPTPLPGDARPCALLQPDEPFGEQKVRLAPEAADLLRALAARAQVTTSTVFQAAWGLLLARHSGEQDVVFGATSAGRSAPVDGIESMLGLFINTLPVRARPSASVSVRSYLKDLQEQQLRAREHEQSQLVDIRAACALPGDQPLFESILVFQNASLGSDDPFRRMGLESSDFRQLEQSSYPLTVVAEDFGAGGPLDVLMAYSERRFPAEQISRLLGHFSTLLDNLARSPDAPLGRVGMLPDSERRTLLHDWNASAAPDVDEGPPVHQRIAAQAERTPEACALEAGSRRMTYRELMTHSHQLAHVLRARGVGPERVVGLLLGSAFDAIPAMLGVLEAGGAYLPLDVDAPEERLRGILADAGAEVVITEARFASKLASAGVRLLVLDTEREAISACSAEALPVATRPGNLAYVVYTSGSTGTPKGVQIAHRSLLNHNLGAIARFGLGQGERVLQFTPIQFDAAGEEIYPTLLVGGTVVVREELVEADAFTALVERERLTVLSLPPSFLDEWTFSLERLGQRVPACLKLVLIGGEAIRPESLVRWRRAGGLGTPWINVYGPTEATITAACAVIDEKFSEPVLPIGRPLPGVQLYILDERLEPCPVGVAGELWIGGVGLARGYLGQPELQAERFMPDPFSGTPGARLYRTGDVARYLPDGQVVFVGRVDRQVKVRGARVELGEIEAVLRSQANLRDAVVVPREHAGEVRLVAYAVPKQGELVEVGALRRACRTRLAPYMVPAGFVLLDELPLSSNGKLDIAALPEPDWQAGTERDFTAPRTPLEETLAASWAKVLRVERVGVDDSFFDLGGHSLLAMQLVSRLKEELGVALPLRELFEAPTVAELAVRIARLQAGEQARSGGDAIRPVSRTGPLPASTAQERLWFVHQMNPASVAYAIPLVLRIRGPLDRVAFERSLDAFVQRHEVLRTTLSHEQGRVVQHIHPAMPVCQPMLDLSGLSEEARQEALQREIDAEVHRPFDLERGPVFRARVIRHSDVLHHALIVVHHIAFDGWSARLLEQELAAFYASFRTGQPHGLPELRIQFADFAVWEREHLTEAFLQPHLDWWRRYLEGVPEVLSLPADRPRPAQPSGRNGRVEFLIPESLAARLRSLAGQEGTTLYSVLTAGFSALLARYSAERTIVLGSITAHRDREDLAPLVGCFVEQLALRIDVDENAPVRALIRSAHQSALDVLEHRFLPFSRLVEELRPERSAGIAPLAQVGIQFDNMGAAETRGFGDLEVEEVNNSPGESVYDLMLVAAESEGLLGLAFNYSQDLFDERRIRRMADHFLVLLGGMVAAPEERVGNLPLLTPAERSQLLRGWEATAVPSGTLVHQLFEESAAAHPSRWAVIESRAGADPGKDLSLARRITYAELERRANALAHRLIAWGVGPEVRVALVMEPSIAAVLGMLAVLKAGGVYVPLDPEAPAERLAFQAREAEAALVLTQPGLRERAALCGVRVEVVDAEAPLAEEPTTAPPCRAVDTNAAYVVFTSGTTGEPKGVVVTHRSVVNHNLYIAERLGLSSEDRVLQFAPLNFDAAVEEIFPVLTRGGGVVVRGELIPYDEMERLVQGFGLTVMSLPPAYVHEWLPWLEQKGRTVPPGIRCVLLGGERIQPESFALWRRLGGADIPWINVYGPTEATVTSAMVELTPEMLGSPVLPIGGPIGNARLYVLDAKGRLLPVGQLGELFIAGRGLARGYLRRPEETAERFGPDPFSEEPGARMYRTGDLARYRENGRIEVVGRADHQVKIRGHRIELGEVEAALASLPDVQVAVVTVRDDLPGGRGLVGYVVAGPSAPAPLGFRELLKARLPAYMLPSAIVPLERLPLTPNGKVDLRALPAPGRPANDTASDSGSELEGKLIAIFEELLGAPGFGPTDDFFAWGGTSLLLLALVDRIKEEFGRELPLTELYDAPTVRAVARMLAEAPQETPSERSPLLVTLAQGPAGGGAPPVFLLPSLGGDISASTELAARLGVEREVVALQPPEFVPGHRTADTFEGLAAIYLEAIRTAQPRGPYFLGGHSFGGNLAYEVARQLVEQGETVGRLFILDSLTLQLIQEKFPQDASERRSYEELVQAGHLPGGVDASLQRRIVENAHAHVDLGTRWRPKPYFGELLLLTCEETRAIGGEGLGWERLAGNSIRTERIPGTHQTLLKSPHVEEVAAVLRRWLTAPGSSGSRLDSTPN